MMMMVIMTSMIVRVFSSDGSYDGNDGDDDDDENGGGGDDNDDDDNDYDYDSEDDGSDDVTDGDDGMIEVMLIMTMATTMIKMIRVCRSLGGRFQLLMQNRKMSELVFHVIN